MKHLLRALVFLLCLVLPAAADGWKPLTVHPGSRMELSWLAPTSPTAPILVVAPGQSCNARRPLFEAIATAARQQGVGLLRLEWSYCSLPEAQRNPSEKLTREQSDLLATLNWLARQPQAAGHRTVLAGKSLGSLVAYATFQHRPELKGLALLTPVCSYAQDDTGKALPQPRNMLAEHYPGLGRDMRPQLISLGNQDSLCHLPYLYAALQATGPQVQLQTFAGGHSLSLMTNANQEDKSASERNLASFAQALISWSWEAIRGR